MARHSLVLAQWPKPRRVTIQGSIPRRARHSPQRPLRPCVIHTSPKCAQPQPPAAPHECVEPSPRSQPPFDTMYVAPCTSPSLTWNCTIQSSPPDVAGVQKVDLATNIFVKQHGLCQRRLQCVVMSRGGVAWVVCVPLVILRGLQPTSTPAHSAGSWLGVLLSGFLL